MRRFTQGAGDGRKIVVVEVRGSSLIVSRLQPDGTTRRSERQFNNEDEAAGAAGQLARELQGRGYEEHGAAKPAKSRQGVASTSGRATAPPSRPSPSSQDSGDAHLLEGLSEGTAAEPVLPRRPASPAESSPGAGAEGPRAKTKPKKKKKKKRKSDANGDGLDKRVLAGIGLVGALLLGGFGYIVYDQFLKPPSIVGTWRGSMTEHEISKYLIHTSYDLVLDEDHRAEMTIDRTTSRGTYTLKGNRLKLSLKSDQEEKLKAELAAAARPQAKGGADADAKEEDGEGKEKEEGDDGPAPIDFGPSETEYKVVVGRATLDLIDPSTNKLVVQLIRFTEPPKVGKGPGGGSPAEAPKDLAAEAAKADPAADAAIAAQEISPKDTAFRVKYPKGWKTDTGSRPDNSYSWVTLENGSAKIGIYADVQGSLMSGSDASRHDEPEGSEFAPVHAAHEMYKKTVAEEFSEYKESKPVVIKAAGLGEGRIAVFNASEGGILGSTVLRGYHVTFLSRDRRVSVICRCPSGEFAKHKATFLAVCRSLGR
ncbi:hypothetical protein [Aquisphaera insulae]|uniref:hypothetical protein n=1 Tax=Aquisphaera insulae TaxID=2712864 RepID=UPI0013EBC3FA|nr:hypothetical protein [Aquisphaera insulae]